MTGPSQECLDTASVCISGVLWSAAFGWFSCAAFFGACLYAAILYGQYLGELS